MNYNIISYIIYLPIISFIMIKIGWVFYKNGEVYLHEIFAHKQNLVPSLNRVLLIGYYLTNLGYAVYTITCWGQIQNTLELINRMAEVLGKMILSLAIMHYFNLLWLKLLSLKKMNNN